MEISSLHGKRLLHIGCYSKYFSHSLNKAGVKIILIDDKEDAEGDAWRYLRYDCSDHHLDTLHAEQIVGMVKDLNLDGCMTSNDDCAPLAGLIASKLGMRGSTYESLLNAKKKSQTMSALCAVDDDGKVKNQEAMKCASASYLIGSVKELNDITESLTYPVMMKLECGAGAVSARVANDEDELRDWYHKITDNFQKEADFPLMGLTISNAVMVMEFHGGSEHDADIVLFDGELLGAFLSDSCTNGTTHSFTETCGVMPSLLSEKKQKEVIEATYQCCRALGLSDGVFNVEVKLLQDGPKLLEVNGRMGGGYRQIWIDNLYHADTAIISAQIAFNIRPQIPDTKPNKTAVGVMITQGINNVSEDDWEELQRMDSDDVMLYERPEEPEFVDNFLPHKNVAAVGINYHEAKDKLLTLCKRFGLSNQKYDVENFLLNLENDICEVDHHISQ